jgi:DNA-3-methyladenine glycosylase
VAHQGRVTNGTFDVLKTDVVDAARRLLGSVLVADVDGNRLCLRIVETEGYDQSDAASHSYRGKTPRTEVMFGPAGYLYVYFTYGMHYCCNVVVGEEGQGAAVLLRAAEPLDVIDALSVRRGGRSGIELTNGPAKLCQALGITKVMNGHNLLEPPLQLQVLPQLPQEQIVQTTRIGIREAKDVPWRFHIKDNPYVSR